MSWKHIWLFLAFGMLGLMIYGYITQNGIGTGVALFLFIAYLILYHIEDRKVD